MACGPNRGAILPLTPCYTRGCDMVVLPICELFEMEPICWLFGMGAIYF